MQILLFVLGWRPLGWTETLGLEGDPWAGRRPLGWTETPGLEGDPWAGWRPLGWKETLGLCRQGWGSPPVPGRAEVGLCPGSRPSPWACRSPRSPPCLSLGLRCPALWQLPAAPDPLPGLLCHLGSGGGGWRGAGQQDWLGAVPSSPAGPATTAGGCCSELRVLPNQEDGRSGAGPGGVTVGRPGLPPPTPTSAPKDPGAERGTPGCVSVSAS